MNNTNTTTFYLQRITGFILLLALSAVFLFSAGAKIWFIEPFEWSFMDILPIGIMTAKVIARLFIGLELSIGLLLLGHIYLKKFTYKASLILLVVLTLYLIVLIAKQGNTGNCGCFGEAYQMTPLNAIWKNLVMIVATVALMFLYPVKPYKGAIWVGCFLALAAFALPFLPYVGNPIYIIGDGKPVQRIINLDPLYKFGNPVPAVDLRKGKHVVIFMSLTCPHCRKAGYFIQIMYRQHPELPFYAVLGGHPENLKDFFNETKSQNLPHSLVTDGHAFSSMAGNAVPAIYFVNNGMVERELYYPELEPAKIKEWLKR